MSRSEQDEPDEIWGAKEWLDPRLVKEGRLDELRRLQHFDVYEVVDEWEATCHVLDAMWVDRQKGSVVRSRIVARQFATALLRWRARRYSPQGHAGCSETRRSTCSGVIQINGHVLGEWSTTQSTVVKRRVRVRGDLEGHCDGSLREERVERARLVHH